MGNVAFEPPPGATASFLKYMQGELEATGLPLNSTSLVLESSRLVKAGAGILYGIGGVNTKAAAQFVQVFDSLTLPADGAVPAFVMTVAASSNISVFWGDVGRFFQAGIFVCNSSTAATKTIGSADCFFDCQYI
jgi:hypothetical protein